MDKAQIMGIIRHILTFAGGFAVAKGWLDEGMLVEVVGGIATIIGVVWSALQKKGQAS